MATISLSIKSRQQHLMARRFGEDVANRVMNRPDSPTPSVDSSSPLKPRTPDTFTRSATRRSFGTSAVRSSASPNATTSPKSSAVPFPTIPEDSGEGDGNGDTENNSVSAAFTVDPAAEELRCKEWAVEIARRQASIKELRDRKLRLEQTHTTTRARKSSPPRSSSPSSNSSISYLTSLDRKLTAEDVDFLSALHASVVWRLWHADLSPEVFASERLLSTRLHLVLMRHGRQNIPVPPIVALSKTHHLVNSQAALQRNMMERDSPGIQTLPQLVAKSLLRKGKPRKSLGKRASNLALRRSLEEEERRIQQSPSPSSPLAKETISPV